MARLEAHNAQRRITRATCVAAIPLAAEDPRRPQRRAVQAAAALRAARAVAAPRASPDSGSADARSSHISPRLDAAFDQPPPPWSVPPADEAAILDDDALLGLFDLGDWLSLEPCGGPGSAQGSGSGSSAAATAAFAAAWPEAGAPNCELSSPLDAAADAGEGDSVLFAACAAAAAAAAAAHFSRRTVHVKLPQHAHVAAPGAAAGPYRHQEALATALPELPLPGALSHLFGDVADVAEAPLGALAASVRPGCTLVTMEALVPPPPRGKPPPPPCAAELLRRALASPGAAGDFLRAQDEVVVADCAGGEATWSRRDGITTQRDVALAPRAPPVHPLAVLCTRDAELSVAFEAEEQGAAQLSCRLSSGRVLPLLPLPAASSSDGARTAHLALPRCDEDGVALIEAVAADTPLHRAGAPRPVLLTSDAAIAAEVAAGGDALCALDAAGGGDVARAHVEQAVLALGAALAPGASPAAVAAGAATALWMGWAAALAALLRTPAFVDGECDARLLSLLCHASAAPRPAMMRLLLTASPTLRRGGALAAALTAEAQAMGHCYAPFAAAAALDALAARQGAAADAAPQAREVAGKLLRAAAAELDAAQANADAESDAEADGDTGAGENAEPGGVNVVAIEQAEHASSLDADVHAFRSTALVILLQYATCAVMRRRVPPLPAQEVLAALPCPGWGVWLRMPTALCCNGASGPVVAAREAAFAAAMLLAFAPGTFARVRAAHVAAMHVAALTYFILIEPALCALATHALFGVAIRQPWQGGVKQAALTLGTHLSTEQRLPRAAHVVMLLLRGALPLAVRAAQAQGPLASPPTRLLAQLRLLPAHVGWDVLHVALALACVAHTEAARRRRCRAQAPPVKAKKE